MILLPYSITSLTPATPSTHNINDIRFHLDTAGENPPFWEMMPGYCTLGVWVMHIHYDNIVPTNIIDEIWQHCKLANKNNIGPAGQQTQAAWGSDWLWTSQKFSQILKHFSQDSKAERTQLSHQSTMLAIFFLRNTFKFAAESETTVWDCVSTFVNVKQLDIVNDVSWHGVSDAAMLVFHNNHCNWVKFRTLSTEPGVCIQFGTYTLSVHSVLCSCLVST